MPGYGGEIRDADLAVIDGGLAVVGAFSGWVDVGSGNIASGPAPRGLFLARYTLTGTPVSVRVDRPAGALAYLDHTHLAVLNDDTLVVAATGTGLGSIDLGGGPLFAHGGSDVLLAAFAPDGTHRWSRLLGGDADEAVTGLSAGEGLIAVGGWWRGRPAPGSDCRSDPQPPFRANFGGADLTTGWCGKRGFVASFGEDGGHRWSRSLAGSGHVDYQVLDLAHDGSRTRALLAHGGPLTLAGTSVPWTAAGNLASVVVAAFDDDQVVAASAVAGSFAGPGTVTRAGEQLVWAGSFLGEITAPQGAASSTPGSASDGVVVARPWDW